MNNIDIDLSTLSHNIKEYKERPVVSGRVLQLDGDFLAYYVTGSKDVGDKHDMMRNALTSINILQKAAGAESVCIHLTPTNSTKGNRKEIALLKPYQANRESKQKPEYLTFIREWMHEQLGAVLWEDCEADDGMSMYQWAAINSNKKDLSVICSEDKDLGIVPGFHLNWKTLELSDVSFFGDLYLQTKYTPLGAKKVKVLGNGFKFFCFQMLAGDPADNISGVPKVFKGNKLVNCGPMTAYSLLRHTKTPKQALDVVSKMYKKYSETNIGFVDYNGNSISVQDAFLSEAKLLWMRRYNDENDIISVLQGVNNGEIS